MEGGALFRVICFIFLVGVSYTGYTLCSLDSRYTFPEYPCRGRRGQTQQAIRCFATGSTMHMWRCRVSLPLDGISLRAGMPGLSIAPVVKYEKKIIELGNKPGVKFEVTHPSAEIAS